MQMFSGSVASLKDVSNTVLKAIAPIKGVLNLSIVLQVSLATASLLDTPLLIPSLANTR